MRVGFSKDIHVFKNGNFIILGGVKIPCDKSFIAHSDGDVVFHSLAEALLGSLALGDLGKYFPENEVKALLSFLRLKGIFLEPTEDIHLCRDSEDDFLLDLAQTAKAHYLITGDKDLLVIQKIGSCKIVDAKTFEEEIK